MPDTRLTGLPQVTLPGARNDLVYIVDFPNTGTNTGTSSSIAINALDEYLSPYFNVQNYGAVSDSYYVDGIVTGSSSILASATANFTAADVGKNIVILRAGASSAQDHHTTIATFIDSSHVTLTNTAGRSQTNCRIYISRSGGQSTAIQAAINAAGAAGGGTVFCPGVGYLIDAQLVLKHRVWIKGSGIRSTMLHAGASLNTDVITNDQTTDNSAMFNSVLDMWVDGNRVRQSDTTTNLTVNYTTGTPTLTLADASNLTNAGSILIGTTRFNYVSKSGNVLQTVVAAIEGTTDANYNSGTTVTQHKSGGIYFTPVPFNSAPLNAEGYDTHFTIRNVLVKNCKGDGIAIWGQSSSVIENCWANYCDHFGFRPSFDTIVSNCVADTNGRSGFFLRSSSTMITACKSFFSGGNVGSEGYGFFVEGPINLEEGMKFFNACNAQDNKADGFYVRNAQRVVISGMASSNGTSATGTYAGIKVEGSGNGIFDLVCADRVSNGTQLNAIILKETAGIKNQGLQIRLTHGQITNAVAIGPAIMTGSLYTGGVNISINGMGGYYSQVYTGTVNPDPYVATTYKIGALTGSITINNPLNAHIGCPINFSLVQDSGGSRNVTFGANYTTNYGNAGNSANKRLEIGFVYDGSTWKQQYISLVSTGTATNWIT